MRQRTGLKPLLVVAVCALAAGCAAPIPRAADAVPPPDTLTGTAAPVAEGEYAGTARLSQDRSGTCRPIVTVDLMFVRDGNVRFSYFEGQTGPDGTLAMSFGKDRIAGRFTGTHFAGTWTLAGCTYTLSMNRR